MTVFMFWNLKHGSAAPYLRAACDENEVDILLLAEAGAQSQPLATIVNGTSGTTRPYIEYAPIPSIIKLLTRYPTDSLGILADEQRVSVRMLTPPIGIPINIFAVHLPSKLHSNTDDQYHYTRQLSSLIVETENRVGHQNSIVIGDFNLNPFEEAMVAADGLHAMPDKITAQLISRKYKSKKYSFFYNPMWSYLGDESLGPPGTYHFNNSSLYNTYWNAFDQAIIRPSMLDYYISFRVVTSIGRSQLVGDGGIDSTVSDHLPIVLELDLSRRVK